MLEFNTYVADKAEDVEAVWVTPDVGRNLSLPPEEQFRVQIRPMTAVEQAAHDRANSPDATRGGKRSENIAARIRAAKHKMIVAHVLEVVNLRITRKDGAVAEPKTGKQLVEMLQSHGDPALYSRIIDAIGEYIVDHSTIEESLWDPSRSQSTPQ